MTEEEIIETIRVRQAEGDAEAFSGIIENTIGKLGNYGALIEPHSDLKNVFLMTIIHIPRPSTFDGVVIQQKTTAWQLIDFLRWLYEEDDKSKHVPKGYFHNDLVEKLLKMDKDFDLWLESRY